MNDREQGQTVSSTRIGTFQGFEVTHGQFGQQYTMIDGTKFITWFDLNDRNLKGLQKGCMIEFVATPAPTVLCHSPRVQECLPSANILRVIQEGGR